MIKLIKFGADYCVPCQQMAPILDEIKDIVFVENIDVDEIDSDILIKYKIKNIPTLILVKDDKELWRHVGNISKSDLLDVIKKI